MERQVAALDISEFHEYVVNKSIRVAEISSIRTVSCYLRYDGCPRYRDYRAKLWLSSVVAGTDPDILGDPRRIVVENFQTRVSPALRRTAFVGLRRD